MVKAMAEQLMFSQIGDWPTDQHRGGVFFAILVDAAAARQMTGLARDLSGEHGLTGRPLAAERLHISLYELGGRRGMTEKKIDAARGAAVTIAAPPFSVAFNCVRSLSEADRPAIALYGGDGDALTEFRRILGEALVTAGLRRAAQSSFLPHVTLLYDERGVDFQAVEPIVWTVNDFVLIHSLRGQSRYIELGRWPLRG
jgi:2'-5' RNA ligase